MRIAQVSHSLDCGGSMAVMGALCLELVKRGHEVDAVCTDRRSGSAHEALWTDRLRGEGVSVHFLGRRRGSAGVLAAARLWHLVYKRRYDVVHSHLPMPDAISGFIRRSGIRSFMHVVTVHNTYEPRPGVLRWLAAGAHVVYCSEAVRDRNALAGKSHTVIPNGIAQVSYALLERTRADVRRQLGFNANARIVIAVGRLCKQKAFDLALRAVAAVKGAARVPDLHCLLCGEGEDREELRALTQELGLADTVHFLGARVDVPRLLSASDAYLSTSRHEGMPLSVLEALSAGMPCVLSAIPEHNEVAGVMPGCIFASQLPEIASALESVLLQLPSPAQLREQRAMALHNFSAAKTADSYLSLYERCRDL